MNCLSHGSIKVENIKLWFCHPQQALSSMEPRLLRETLCWGAGILGAALAGRNKNQKSNQVNKMVHAWKRNPLSDLENIWQGDRRP